MAHIELKYTDNVYNLGYMHETPIWEYNKVFKRLLKHIIEQFQIGTR